MVDPEPTVRFSTEKDFDAMEDVFGKPSIVGRGTHCVGRRVTATDRGPSRCLASSRCGSLGSDHIVGYVADTERENALSAMFDAAGAAASSQGTTGIEVL